MIWEHTWPAPRIIEESYCFAESSESDYTILHPGGPLSMELKNLGWGFPEEEPFKKSSEPVALHVCRESRTHTLRKYVYMKHADTLAGSFYFSPSRDVLYLDIRDDDYFCPKELLKSYASQLNKFEMVLVGESYWVNMKPIRYTRDFLTIFQGLKAIRVFSSRDHFREEPICEYARSCLEHPELKVKTLELMDRSGHFY
jgi:hypothetical protein